MRGLTQCDNAFGSLLSNFGRHLKIFQKLFWILKFFVDFLVRVLGLVIVRSHKDITFLISGISKSFKMILNFPGTTHSKPILLGYLVVFTNI